MLIFFLFPLDLGLAILNAYEGYHYHSAFAWWASGVCVMAAFATILLACLDR